MMSFLLQNESKIAILLIFSALTFQSYAACEGSDDVDVGKPIVEQCMNSGGTMQLTLHAILSQEKLPDGLWGGRNESDFEFAMNNCQINENLHVNGSVRGIVKRFEFAVNDNSCTNFYRANDMALSGAYGGSMKGAFTLTTPKSVFTTPITITNTIVPGNIPAALITMIDPQTQKEKTYTSTADFGFTDWLITISGDSSSWLRHYTSRIKKVYPQFFNGFPSFGRYQDIDYAYFPSTGNYVGLQNREVILYGPYTNNKMQAVGDVRDITTQIELSDALIRADTCKRFERDCD